MVSKASERDAIWFPSKIDWWLGALLVLLPLWMLGILVLSLMSGDKTEIIIAIASFLFIVVLYLLLLIPTRYGITHDKLIVRFGVVRHRIALDAIKEVRPSRTPLSSPALSMDRLSIRTGSRYSVGILISPADRAGFLRTLAERAGLERDGEGLVRRGTDE